MKVNSPLRIIAAVAAVIGILQTANAQNNSPFWSLQGNSNATTSSKFGTLNGVPLKIYAGNNIRMNINNGTGNVAIGNGATASTSYRLYVKGTGYGIYGTGTSYGIVGAGGSYGVYGSGTTAGVYASGGTYGTQSYGSSYGVYGSSGSTGVYGTGTNYGMNGYSYKGYGGLFTSDSSDAVDAISNGGFWGVYAYAPRYAGVYGYGGSYGVYGSSSSKGVYGYSSGSYGLYGYGNYGLYAETRNNSSYYAGYFVGDVFSTTGVYAGSDQKLKQNIRDVSSAMKIINQLHPKLYEFKQDGNFKAMNLPKGEHYGLIAQDLEKVLPNLVKNSQFEVKANTNEPVTKDNVKTLETAKSEVIDFKAVNYTELIPLLIRGMQEQNDKIEALTQQVASLTDAKQAVNNNSVITAKLSSANLGQSTPNPAKNSTSIRYNNLPINANAQLLVYDANGKMMKQIQLNKSGSGSVNIDVSTLSAGRYSYSLLIDGKLIDTKAMEIAR